MSDCIFCGLLAGELPATFLFRDEQCAAFMDITRSALEEVGSQIVRALDELPTPIVLARPELPEKRA